MTPNNASFWIVIPSNDNFYRPGVLLSTMIDLIVGDTDEFLFLWSVV